MNERTSLQIESLVCRWSCLCTNFLFNERVSHDFCFTGLKAKISLNSQNYPPSRLLFLGYCFVTRGFNVSKVGCNELDVRFFNFILTFLPWHDSPWWLSAQMFRLTVAQNNLFFASPCNGVKRWMNKELHAHKPYTAGGCEAREIWWSRGQAREN